MRNTVNNRSTRVWGHVRCTFRSLESTYSTHRIVLIRKERFFRWRKLRRKTGYKSTHCSSFFAESIFLPVILKRYYNVTIEIALRLNGKTCDTRTCQLSSCDLRCALRPKDIPHGVRAWCVFAEAMWAQSHRWRNPFSFETTALPSTALGGKYWADAAARSTFSNR